MARNPQRARDVASAMLVLENPAPRSAEERAFAAEAALTEAVMRLQSEGIDVGSISLEEWERRLRDLNLSDAQVGVLLEDVAQYAVTDSGESP